MLPTIPTNFTDGQVVMKDNTPTTPISTGTIACCNGDFNVGGMNEGNREVTKYESRGQRVGQRKTNRKYPTGSFSVMLLGLTNATPGLVYDAVRKTGAFSAGISKSTGGVWTVDIVFTISGTDFSGTDIIVTCTECLCTIDGIGEGDPNVVTVSFEVLGTITATNGS